MKFFISTLFVLFSMNNLYAGTNMKVEGTCTGQLKNGQPVSISYYSDFDGCKAKSNGAISFNGEENSGLRTGERSFKNDKDLYDFDDVKLVFANSTGNTTGSLTYSDENNQTQHVELQCEVRDYEYMDC
ncbi:hypothetical protein [Peredibacter starrii]|uniref:Uncharacterized protein n=1 Tax=Peredibacter starrii TaxID=28202 RepID=A0AAX4HTY2_9BACT|nr:hypothetical protein [Peredibacter starrii]WPU66853.1 hypothetical protein SOO65_08835 [Peredibacter starrii]